MTQPPEERDDAANAVDFPSPAPRGRRPADTFAVRLLLVRHLNGWTIAEAAAAAGLNDATWSTWEAGRRPRDILDVCRRIAEAGDIDEHWLLFGGPLAGPRGVPAKRSAEVNKGYPRPLPPAEGDNRRYPLVNVRPTDTRPSGRPGANSDRVTGPAPRRPVRISRPQAA